MGGEAGAHEGYRVPVGRWKLVRIRQGHPDEGARTRAGYGDSMKTWNYETAVALGMATLSVTAMAAELAHCIWGWL